jgi:hypothetical protein
MADNNAPTRAELAKDIANHMEALVMIDHTLGVQDQQIKLLKKMLFKTDKALVAMVTITTQLTRRLQGVLTAKTDDERDVFLRGIDEVVKPLSELEPLLAAHNEREERMEVMIGKIDLSKYSRDKEGLDTFLKDINDMFAKGMKE